MENTDKTVEITVKEHHRVAERRLKLLFLMLRILWMIENEYVDALAPSKIKETIFIINFQNKYHKLIIFCQKRKL